MLKEKWMLSLSLFVFVITFFYSIYFLSQNNNNPKVDVLEINAIIKEAEKNWNNLSNYDFSLFLYDFSILDKNEKLIFSTNDKKTSSTLYQAIQNQDIILDIAKDNQVIGKILITSNFEETLKKKEQKIFLFTICAFLLFALLIIFYFIYLNYKVFSPFQKLHTFAAHIASGNLELSLQMDKDNLFGPFTESFDIMREQLLKAKRAEAKANQSKKELIASLSHDIKTPVTSIKLISELLEITIQQNDIKNKIHTILQKTEQIDRLITNMFQASLEDLEELDVNISEENSAILKSIIENADYYKKVTMSEIPGCIIQIDSIRLEQIFDNIINNSYKYANTNIDIFFSLTDEFLKIQIQDYGSGISETEILKVFQKFFRGQNASEQKQDGAGLGLYICHYLIEKMNGTIQCYNQHNGFCIELLLSLA